MIATESGKYRKIDKLDSKVETEQNKKNDLQEKLQEAEAEIQRYRQPSTGAWM